MRAVDIIAKKRDGETLSGPEIEWFVKAYTQGEVTDYQAAAWLMAVCIRGMTREETSALTLAMAHSGDVLDLSDVLGYAVDKHSSGGVGDKTTLVVLPLVAACGVPVAKMSGRGLGYSGGTIDKLESFAGYRVDLPADEFRALARRNGIVLSGQSMELAPADGKLYKLRDVTATVPSTPLIASSIMSKKIAGGAQGIVLDVKLGSGAFMPDLQSARHLAETMVAIGEDVGRDVIAVLSDMNQPLGYAVGNALEVVEAIETLQGRGPADFQEHCLSLAAFMLRLAGQGKRWTTTEEARALLEDRLAQGAALERFRALVGGQGGDVSMVDDPARLPSANIVVEVTAQQSGYVQQVSAIDVARAAFELGAGRERKEDPIDLAVGVKVYAKVGDPMQPGRRIATLYANDESLIPAARAYLDQAIGFSAQPVEPLPLFYDVIYGA